MPGKVYSSNSYSSEESSSSSSCKREWLIEKRTDCNGNDDQKDFKHRNSSSGSFSFSSSTNRKYSREQQSQSPVSRYSLGHGPSYKENEESKGRKRRRSDRSSRWGSSEHSVKRRCSNTYPREDSHSQNPKNSRQSSYSSYPSHSRSDKRTEFNNNSKSYHKVHSVISRPSMKYEEKWRFSSSRSESRYNRTSYKSSRARDERDSRKCSVNSTAPKSSRDRRRSSVTSNSSGSSYTRERSVSSGSGDRKIRKPSPSPSASKPSYSSLHSRSSGKSFKRGSSPSGKQPRQSNSPSDMSHVSNNHSQASLECQCEQDLGLNGQESRYGSAHGYSFSPVEDGRVKWNMSYQTPRTPMQHSAAAPSSSSHEAWATQFVARSKTYCYNFIDSHCHIDFLYNRMGVPFNTPYSEFMRNHTHSYPDNYEGCVAVFCNPRTFNLHRPQDTILNMVSKESGVWLALGCHPKSATEFGVSHEQGLRKMLSHPKVVALGEIGLDYSGRFGIHAEVQKRVLITQLKLALELNLPLVIHCRDADVDCLYIMKQYVPRNHKIHLHCFSRDPTTAQHWMNAFPNLYFGFTPVITYSSAWEPAISCHLIPLDRLLLETDAPYFVPGQIKKTSVKFSHPGFALFTAEKIAELRGISVDEVLKACRENTRKMYGI